MEVKDNYTFTLNAVLNEIFADHIRTKADVMYYVSGYNPNMTVGELVNLIGELEKYNKIH